MIYTYAFTGIASAAIAFAGAWTVKGWSMDAQLSQLKTEYATAQAQAVEKAHAETIRLQARKDDAERVAKARQSALARDVAGARDALGGVRDELAAAHARLPSAACGSIREYAATANELFGECAAAIEGLAGQAQGHAIDVQTLIGAWPK